MKTLINKLRHPASYIAMMLIALVALTSCGSIRTYGGIEHDYTYDFDNHHHKKHKKHHHKKHRKHKHHHHHHDD